MELDSDRFSNMEAYVKKRLLEDGCTFEKLTNDLKLLFPGETGFSIRSLKRYCTLHGIKQRNHINNEQLKSHVQESIVQLGLSCGVRTVQGHLRSKGIVASQKRIAVTLREANPDASATRKETMGRSLNPIPYSAEGFGHKFHMDQNEKLVHYGVTIVIMVDGYSRMMLSYAVMPVKNNIIIYNKVYRDGVLKYGLCQQVRTDFGKEFDLVHYIHKSLLSKESRRTKSSKNMAVERQWVDLNSRVFYPIKRCLVSMEEAREINVDNLLEKHAVSAVSCLLVNIGVKRYVDCHNHQRVQGRGIPRVLMQQRNVSKTVNISNVPSQDVALQFAAGDGHYYTYPSAYGADPLSDLPRQCEQRMDCFEARVNLERLYSEIMLNQKLGFLNGIKCWQDITLQLEATM